MRLQSALQDKFTLLIRAKQSGTIAGFGRAVQLLHICGKKIVRCAPAQPLIKRGAMFSVDDKLLHAARLRYKAVQLHTDIHYVAGPEYAVCLFRIFQLSIAMTVQTVIVAIVKQQNLQLPCTSGHEIPVATV